MQKEYCTKFCCILIRFQVVVKLQSFEFSVDDGILVNVQVISSLVFSAFFLLVLLRENLSALPICPPCPSVSFQFSRDLASLFTRTLLRRDWYSCVLIKVCNSSRLHSV